MSRRRRGAAAIEFALWMPIMLLMFGGVVDLSLFMNQTHQVNRIARESARFAASLNAAQLADTSTTAVTEDSMEAACLSHAAIVLYDVVGTCTTCSFTCDWRTDTSALGASMSLVPEVVVTQVGAPYTPLLGLLPTLTATSTQATFVMVTQMQVNETVP